MNMYVALALAVVFTLYILYSLIKKNTTVLEGLSNKDNKTSTRIQDIVNKLKKESEILEDTLLIEKHRADYEDLFLALEDYSNLSLIKLLSNFSLNTRTSKNMIQDINNLNSLKTTLNDVMEFMDRKK